MRRVLNRSAEGVADELRERLECLADAEDYARRMIAEAIDDGNPVIVGRWFDVWTEISPITKW